jgi:hypothetical protein
VILAALSVQDFIDKVGAYVGFAAAIGLALFALLLFAQARELKRLREWGAQAHDRIGELERRLAAALELARRASAAQRTGGAAATGVARPAAAARPGAAPLARTGAPAIARTSSPTRLPLLPSAPARVGGAALGSATVFVPLPKHPPGTAPASAPVQAPATSAPAPAVAPPATPPAAAPAPAAPRAAPAPATVAAQGPAQPAPATPAPKPPAPTPAPTGANGHSDTFPPVPPVRRPAPPARAAAGRRPAARPPARPGQRPVPAAPLRARGPAAATPRGAGNGASEAPPHRRRLPLLLAGLGVLAAAAIAAIALSGGNESPSPTAAGSNRTPAQTTGAVDRTTPAAAPAHDRITVAVLNGTTTSGLAQTVASNLVADGFVQGAVTNATDQSHSFTVVSYLGGREREAQEVARVLGVSSDAVGPIDADTEQACGQGGACTATVVVTVGADRQ